MKPQLFLTHNGINIWHVHKEGHGKGRPTLYVFSTCAMDNHYSDAFDIRDKGMKQADETDWTNPDGSYNPNWLAGYEERQREFLRGEIDAGRITAPIERPIDELAIATL